MRNNLGLLAEKLECPLLRLVPRLNKVLERLLAKSVLLLGNDATVLVLHEVLLLEATARVVRRAMPDLRVRTDSAASTAHLLIHTHRGHASCRWHIWLHHVILTAHLLIHTHRHVRLHHVVLPAIHHLARTTATLARTTRAAAATTATLHRLLMIAICAIGIAIGVLHLYLYIRFFLRPASGFFQTLLPP